MTSQQQSRARHSGVRWAQPYQFRLASRRPSNWADGSDEDGVQYTLGAAAKGAALNDEDSAVPNLVRSVRRGSAASLQADGVAMHMSCCTVCGS